MKLLIFIALLSFCYCLDNNEEYKNEEKRIAGGGHYGGFISLTTYGAGPFLVKGKYERDYREADVENQKTRDSDNKQGDSSYIENSKNDYDKEEEGYDVQSGDRVSYNGGNSKEDDIEYLGYDGEGCIGQFEHDNKLEDRNKYGRERYRDRNKSNKENSNYSRYYNDETKDRCDYVFGYTGPTANDEPENLMRPCALDDWQCIRNYFAANSKCKPAYGPIPDPLYTDINTVFYPVVNLTVALPNLEVRGLSSANIREFYVNKQSGNLVFAIDVTNLNETIPRAYFRYRRTAKESIVLADYATIEYHIVGPQEIHHFARLFHIEYRAITFTAVIPKVPNLRLDLADIHADIQDPLPLYFIGPGAYNSTDPDVVTAFTQFNLLVPFDVREGLLFQAQLFTSIYIQKNICDFGLQIISV